MSVVRELFSQDPLVKALRSLGGIVTCDPYTQGKIYLDLELAAPFGGFYIWKSLYEPLTVVEEKALRACLALDPEDIPKILMESDLSPYVQEEQKLEHLCELLLRKRLEGEL